MSDDLVQLAHDAAEDTWVLCMRAAEACTRAMAVPGPALTLVELEAAETALADAQVNLREVIGLLNPARASMGWLGGPGFPRTTAVLVTRIDEMITTLENYPSLPERHRGPVANARGFMVRVKGSQFFRPPPAGSVNDGLRDSRMGFLRQLGGLYDVLKKIGAELLGK